MNPEKQPLIDLGDVSACLHTARDILHNRVEGQRGSNRRKLKAIEFRRARCYATALPGKACRRRKVAQTICGCLAKNAPSMPRRANYEGLRCRRHTRGSRKRGDAVSLRRSGAVSLTASNCRSRPMISRAALSDSIADFRAIDGHFSSWQDYQSVIVRDFESKKPK